MPQLLRPLGILVYSETLASLVDERVVIPPSSEVRFILFEQSWATIFFIFWCCMIIFRKLSIIARNRAPRRHGSSGRGVEKCADVSRSSRTSCWARLAIVAARGGIERCHCSSSSHAHDLLLIGWAHISLAVLRLFSNFLCVEDIHRSTCFLTYYVFIPFPFNRLNF